MKRFISGFAFILCLGFVLGCASTRPEGAEGSLENSKKIVIEPFLSYEECIEVLPRQILQYSFQSSKPLDFNIHYHGDEKVHYPVSQEKVRSSRGSLHCDEQDYYVSDQEYFCLMWENHNASRVRLTFEVEVRDR